MAVSAVLNALWDLRAKREGKPLWKLLRRPEPGTDRRHRRLQAHQRRAHPRGGPRPAPPKRRRARRARGATESRRLSGLHDHPRLARIHRREAGPSLPRGRRRRLRPDQAQGRCQSGRGRPPTRCRSRGSRPGHQAGDRRQPALGRQRGDRAGSTRSPRSSRTGSRNPPVPTTCSGTPTVRKGVAPVKVATGEHVQNRVMFKQLFQAGAVDVAQIDACRVGGVNENIAILLMAAKYGDPGLPARRRCGAVRAGAAPLDVRLRGRLGHLGGPPHRVRRPPSRALPRPRGDRVGPLRGSRRPRLQRPDARRDADALRLPRTDRCGRATRRQGVTTDARGLLHRVTGRSRSPTQSSRSLRPGRCRWRSPSPASAAPTCTSWPATWTTASAAQA